MPPQEKRNFVYTNGPPLAELFDSLLSYLSGKDTEVIFEIAIDGKPVRVWVVIRAISTLEGKMVLQANLPSLLKLYRGNGKKWADITIYPSREFDSMNSVDRTGALVFESHMNIPRDQLPQGIIE